MKYFLYSLVLLSLFACKQQEKTQKANAKARQVAIIDFSPQSNTGIFVSAHRGGGVRMENWPENCLETMKYVHDQGVQIFEIDVTQTVDSVLVLLHDRSLDRTTTGQGKIVDTSWETVRKLRLKDDFGNLTTYAIPPLKDVLQWATENKVYLTLDLKGVDENLLIQAIDQAQAHKNCALIAYSITQSERLYKLAPDMMLSVPMRNAEEVDRMLATGIPTNRMLAFTGTRRSAPGLNQQVKDLGVMVIFGTLGNIDKSAAVKGEKVYHDLIAEGVQIFATDRPLAVKKAIKTYSAN